MRLSLSDTRPSFYVLYCATGEIWFSLEDGQLNNYNSWNKGQQAYFAQRLAKEIRVHLATI